MSRTTKPGLRQAKRLLQQGRLEDGIALLTDLRTKNPDNFDIVYMLGVALVLAGDLDTALDALVQASSLKPGHVKANTAVGLVFARKGEFKQALEYFDWSLRLDPLDLEALRCRGGVLAELSRYDEAIEQWERMGEKGEQSIEVQFSLGQIYSRRGDFVKAERYYKRVLRFPGDSTLHEAARIGLTKIAEATLRFAGDLRMDVVMYCLSALQRFNEMGRKKLHVVLLEIALVGRAGLDVNDPSRKYHLQSMEGSFTGLQLVAYLFTGFKVIGESMDVGMDLSREYETARQLWERGGEDHEGPEQ
jgi:tetratricopeptide (TPR) repeat protein